MRMFSEVSLAIQFVLFSGFYIGTSRSRSWLHERNISDSLYKNPDLAADIN